MNYGISCNRILYSHVKNEDGFYVVNGEISRTDHVETEKEKPTYRTW